MGRVRVYIACSLDGYIAGPNDDLSWLEPPDPSAPEAPSGLAYEAFIADVGAILMGRGTYDVVAGFDAWPYGEMPVIVATTRALEDPSPTVASARGGIEDLIGMTHDQAGGKDVYLDGGGLIDQALTAGLIDELVLTLVPVVLGGGVRLFGDRSAPIRLSFEDAVPFGIGMVQLRLRPDR